jgi:hypothetical protein
VEQRGAASGLGVGAWAAAVFAVQYGIARAVYAFDTTDAVRSVVLLGFLCSLAVGAGIVVGIRRRLRGCPGELPARLAVWILALGAIALAASLAVSTISETASLVLFNVSIASLSAATLVACFAIVKLPSIPRWAPIAGAVGSLGALGLAIYHALPLPDPPGVVLAASHGVCAASLTALWIGVLMAVSKEAFIPKNAVVVGFVFVTLGLLALTSLLQGQFGEHPTLNLNAALGVAQIGVGRGLLLGRRSSRRWAYVWLALWTGVSIAFSIWAGLEPGTALSIFGTVTLRGWSALPWVWAAFAVVVAASVAMVSVLRSKSVSDYIAWSEGVRAELTAQVVARREAGVTQTALAPVEPGHRADAAR